MDKKWLPVVASYMLGGLLSAHAQVTAYDTLDTSATSGLSQLSANNPVYGDTLTLTAGGKLVNFGLSLYNSSSSGNTGYIYAGDTTVNFYDNTIPYTGGPINNPLLGTAVVSWDFYLEGGLDPGFYETQTVDLSSLNIILPQQVLVTQQFNQTDGFSIRYGVILFSDPIVGSSPNTIFVSSSTTSPGLSTVSGNPGQVGYQIDVLPGGNNPPIALPQSVTVNQDNNLPITLAATDADNDPLTYSIINQPTNGTLTGTAPNVVYHPNLHFSGADSFTFKANDGHVDSAPAQISITVNPPSAGLIIIPVWDSTITSDPNAAAIENTINTAIQTYQGKFSDPITVTITFAEMSSGLGQSSTYLGTISYSSFYTALAADAKTTTDTTALAHIPGGSVNPVDGTTSIRVTTANQRALGINSTPPVGQSDSTISLNMSIMNIDRVTINPSKYDLLSVVSHEIDEALGTASGLTRPNAAPADLFRYTSGGARSYTTAGDNAYLSIDGGVTDLVRYNQSASGDYGDWWSTGSHTPRVQDAFGTPGATPNLGVELTLLDAIGYDLVVPPPPIVLQNVTHAGGTIVFSWASAAGASYQVQYKTNLTQNGWLNLNGPVTATGPTMSTTNSIGPDLRRFYRVALQSTNGPTSLPRAKFTATGPLTLVTNYFLPAPDTTTQAHPAKSQPAAETEPAPMKFRGTASVRLRKQP